MTDANPQDSPRSYLAEELAHMHSALVDTIAQERPFASALVEQAFRAIPRHLFLPNVDAEKAYRNDAVVTHRSEEGAPLSSSTQPVLMAMMIEQLDLRPGHRVLEIGTATGYNAAILRHIVGSAGTVVTIDIDEEIVAAAAERLAAIGFGDIVTVTADGGFGWPACEPYDRILVTVGAPDIPPAWREQLKDDGRLVVPLSLFRSYQRSFAFVKRDNHLESISHHNCGFLTLRGAFGAPDENMVELGDVPTVVVVPEQDDPASVDGPALRSMLRGAFVEHRTGVAVAEREVYFRLMPRLSIRIPHLFLMIAVDEAYHDTSIPTLFDKGDRRAAVGAFDAAGLGIVARAEIEASRDETVEPGTSDEQRTIELVVRAYGADDTIAMAMVAAIQAWDDSGRPKNEDGLKVRVLPEGAHHTPDDGEIVITKPRSIIVVTQTDSE